MESKLSSGIDCLTAIGIVFIVLKVLAVEPVAHWSWLWVLCPFWMPIALVVIICCIAAIFISRQ